MVKFRSVKPSIGLSVIIITRNEEKDISACLESVKTIANEIIVVDSGSIDRTVDICKKYTEKIFNKPWAGFGPQKQFALDKATGPWVLNLDADERLTPELRDEIVSTLAHMNGSASINGFHIPFRHYFLGKRLRFGGSVGEKHIRLFKKDQSKYGDTKIHEGITVNPPLDRLKGAVDHFSYSSIEDYLHKCNFYTSLIAAQKYAEGQRFSWLHHFRLPYEFFVRYILKFGFLDGSKGLVYALLSSYYVWLKFVKLKDLEEEKK